MKLELKGVNTGLINPHYAVFFKVGKNYPILQVMDDKGDVFVVEKARCVALDLTTDEHIGSVVFECENAEKL